MKGFKIHIENRKGTPPLVGGKELRYISLTKILIVVWEYTIMRRTINLRIPYDKDIVDTLEIATSAYNEACRTGFENRVKNKNKLHHLVYYSIRESHPELPASLVC